MTRIPILAALAVLSACTVHQPDPTPEPTGHSDFGPLPYVGFGKVRCEITAPEDGTTFPLIVDDQEGGMAVRSKMMANAFLPRDEELTDAETHIAVITDGAGHTISITLSADRSATLTVINPETIRLAEGQCEPI